ncbi:MAG: hypothetical protein B193_0012 [Solidesulfovibrio magneticus str. Maddingley MBC34]|uniref:Uncharacterized protein n=1 Tax=Solidesulfovibrio magneticus str. Maddingley MBC34 TaxID=1206767 RepID=K6GWD1_9BACT|nr:MAG: hypothetical protein B193_0012 [Solidesulfovibrio magneticus str. Maddingley MBC34]
METQHARKPGGLRACENGASCNALLYARAAAVKLFALLAVVGRAGGTR